MIRCVRLWTGDDQNSYFEEGVIELKSGPRGDWLSGTLDFQTREGEHFLIHPGNVLLAEDTVGSGHSWKLTDDSSWRRAYVVLQPGATVPFCARKLQRVTA